MLKIKSYTPYILNSFVFLCACALFRVMTGARHPDNKKKSGIIENNSKNCQMVGQFLQREALTVLVLFMSFLDKDRQERLLCLLTFMDVRSLPSVKMLRC